jgi:hypothetical protein
MKRRKASHTATRGRDFAETGHHCPYTGLWAPLEGTSTPRFVTLGQVMPSVEGAPMRWRLISEEGPTLEA